MRMHRFAGMTCSLLIAACAMTPVREPVSVVTTAEQRDVSYAGGTLTVRQVAVTAGERKGKIVLVHDASRNLAWWAPLRPRETALEVASRLKVSEGVLFDLLLANTPPTIVLRDFTNRTATLDEARAHVARMVAADPRLLDVDHAYRAISLAPHLDRSFYEQPHREIGVVVYAVSAERRNEWCVINLLNIYRGVLALFTLY